MLQHVPSGRGAAVQPRPMGVRPDGPKVRCAAAWGLGIKTIAVRAVPSCLTLTLAGVVLSLLPRAAHGASTCPGGDFIGRAFAESVDPTVLAIGDDGRVSRFAECTVKPHKGRRSWPLRARLTKCEGLPAKVTLRGRWDGCNELVVTLRGRKFRRTLGATRSRCGDGFIDRTNNEQCESASDCRVREDCSDVDCRCESVDVLPGDDGDCIPGSLEARLGLNRASPDTDGDGVDDGAEDLDGDGLTNCDEVARGTALDDVDTDHDGATDAAEVAAGTDPLTPVLREIAPREVVGGTITPTDRGDAYQFVLDDDRRVIIRAVDISRSATFSLCAATFDTEGKRRGPARCGNAVAYLSNDLPAGTYAISVYGEQPNQSGEYRLQFLPLDDDPAIGLRRDPDTFVDASLPAPFGLWNVHRFTVDGTRRVSVRLEARELTAGFEPCFAVLRPDGSQVEASNRCSAQRADRDVELTSGTYYVVVSDQGDTNVGPYRLRVLQFHPDFARELSGGPQCRTLDGWSDLDIFRIDPEGADQLTLTQESSEEFFRPCLRVWDQAGVQLLPPPEVNSCTGPITIDLPAGGYYASVHDDSRDATGSYCLTQ